MKKLLIVESPAKIKTISKFLGSDFKIMSTVGHIMDLPSKKLGVTLNDDTIELEYVPLDRKERVIADICKAAATAQEIYLAPDPDREGEIIAWHIGQEIEKLIKDKSRIHRITFNEITKPAIQQAILEKNHIDLDKVAAQQARRVLDRWVGYEVSPILWRKLQKGLSAGRVQSVALRLICEREEAIRNFKPDEYWSITGTFEHNKDKFDAVLTHINKKKIEIKDKKKADEVVAEIKKNNYVVTEVKDKKRIKNPVAPFMTSTLQQAAFNRMGFSVKKTMTIAQKLYEGLPFKDPSSPVALITYMRTDSLRLSDTAIGQARDYIGKTFDKTYLPTKANVYAKGGKAQDAHEAIRPIDTSITPEIAKKYLSRDEARLYELIWQRFVACQMKSAIYAQRQVVIDGGKYTFKVTGSTLIFDGFLKVYGVDEDEKEKKTAIPKDIKAKDPLGLKKINPKQHFTQPPPKYSEGSLVKELEKEGIGRPSTYAAILSTIQARKYVTLEKKRFMPTELGMAVTKMLVDNLPKIMNVKFTALMEEDLDKIAQGELERDALLREFYAAFKKDLDAFLGNDKTKKAEPTDVQCPKCKQHQLAIRFGKAGAFLGCLGYPDCDFTSNFKRNEDGTLELIQAEAPKLLEEVCPKCGKNLREVRGKFGMFKACSGYPECKFIPQVKASFKCLSCKKGDIIQRKWRGGTMYGCSNYPKCKFAIFSDIEEIPCPECKLPFLMKKFDKDGNITLVCSEKTCGYKKAGVAAA
ncbi:MAG: type I DNA topoisomerase [Candidatus Dependentiae bacterium]